MEIIRLIIILMIGSTDNTEGSLTEEQKEILEINFCHSPVSTESRLCRDEIVLCIANYHTPAPDKIGMKI